MLDDRDEAEFQSDVSEELDYEDNVDTVETVAKEDSPGQIEPEVQLGAMAQTVSMDQNPELKQLFNQFLWQR